MLELQKLAHRFSEFTLHELSLQIPAGSRVAVLGLNASGKSTLLRCIAGELPAESGKVFWQAKELSSKFAERRSHMSFLPQHLHTALSCAALEFVLFSITEQKKWLHFDQLSEIQQAEHYLKLTHTQHLAKRQLDTLSGGERQRVALSALLSRNTPLLLLDEPFTFLDIREQKNMLQLFTKLQQHNPQLTLIMSSHQLELMQHWCTHAMILQQGQLSRFLGQAELAQSSLLQAFADFA